MRRRLPSLFTVLVVLALVVPTQAGMTADETAPVRSVINGLLLSTDQLIPKTEVAQVALPKIVPPAKPLRIALISTGVDRASFPAEVAKHITELGSTGDITGFGTQSASVLFQLAPSLKLTSIGIYPSGKFSYEWLLGALSWVSARPGEFDAVLYAVPSNEFLDPISAAMGSRSWDAIIDAISDNPLKSKGASYFGLAVDPEARRKQIASASPGDAQALWSFGELITRWHKVRTEIQRITGAGVGFISPAGDVGPGMQTILGIGNLPEVITVGGFDGRQVSSKSSSGPSIDGRIKPDLVAPTGVVSLAPQRSKLADGLSAAGLSDPSLEPSWAAGDPPTPVRSRIDSTFTSAAYVSVAVATMSAGGLRDVSMQKGALTAASVPLDGVPVWRQGAGSLRAIPTAAFARSRSLALTHADLGPQPDSGEWSTKIAMAGPVTAATPSLSRFAGVSPAGNFERQAASAPGLGVAIDNTGIKVSAPLGTGTYEGGLYCGYTQISIPGTGSDVAPSVRIEGVPDGLEQVPTCLVQGTRLRAHNFYIHDTPAENLTFGLLPALPGEASLLEHHLMVLPIDVLHTKLFFKVSGPDGNADFFNIPPGYYKLRQWSDYGAPITQTLASSKDGTPVNVNEEIGENPSYQSYDALVLSSTGWTEKDLRDKFGDSNVSADKPTGGYFVKVGPRTIRVILGFTKKMPGPGVSSRYIDLMEFEDIDFGSMPSVNLLSGTRSLAKSPLGSSHAWSFEESITDADDFSATFNPAHALSSAQAALGIGTYRFDLTTPNYKSHMSLNFSYELTNAIVGVIVQMGEETAIGVVTPQGKAQLPTVSPSSPIDLSQFVISGKGDGQVNFEFHIKPKGAAYGTMTFVFVPSYPVRQLANPISTAKIGDLSFELDTWTNTLWPATGTRHGMGHAFSIDPNYNASQMNDGCRDIDSGTVRANVCEEWQVMVHSPGDDAATVDLIDDSGSMIDALRSYGATYFDPRRGTSDFSFGLTVPAISPPATVSIGGSLALPFKTNGRFWEQVALTHDLVKAHPGPITVQIVDNLVGRQSPLMDHTPGGEKVGPYVPFRSRAVVEDFEFPSL